MQKNLFDLRGEVAVVTGAGSGLGYAFAHALASSGASVICADIDGAAASACAESIARTGGAGIAGQVDVSDERSVREFMAGVARDHPAIDVLVNNAGVAALPALTHDIAIEEWDRVMAVNVRGTFLCSRAVLGAMRQAKKGVIVNIASFIGLVGVYPSFPVSNAAYACSKAAIVGFTKQVAAEYAQGGIRANVIAPGWHGGTQLGRARRATATPEDIARFERHILSSVPMGRRGKPAEMDALIVYLASSASSYVTGQVFSHDGGLTAV